METVDDETTTAALDFMDRAHQANKPFFVWWNSTRMHIFTHLKSESEGKTGLGVFPDGMVEHDGHIGQLLDKLDELGIADNTIIMYSTDNGAETFSWPDGGTTPFRGEKNTQWEGGYRVPCLIKWPGVIQPGTKINGIAAHEDMLPTLMAEPMEGNTTELRFESRQPPGTESWEVVVSATAMKIEQTWNPLPNGDIDAGDVIVRTITRTAKGTTAMLLRPVSNAAPEGIQVYTTLVDVQDAVQRGDTKATRTDNIKYQFQQSGRFRLPTLTFEWWDPEQQQVQSESVAGLDINVVTASVANQPLTQSQTNRRSVWMITAFGLLVLGLVTWLAYKPIGRWMVAWRARRNRPDVIAARKLRAACDVNDASVAYAAFKAWLAARRVSEPTKFVQQQPLREPFRALSRYLFADCSTNTTWQGAQLWEAFTELQRQTNRTVSESAQTTLPPLNPTAS